MLAALDGLLVALFGGLALTLLVAGRRGDVAAGANVLASIAVALLSVPLATALLAPDAGGSVARALPIWVTAAGLLHSVGMLGVYESVWWWDHLTHTVSAALVAALLYAGAIVALDGGTAWPPSVAVVAVTVGYTTALGVFWELVELVARAVAERYDVEPVLVHYGWRDTALDLVFDVVGAALVVALDVRLFVALAGDATGATRALLGWTGGAVVVGSALLLLALAVGAPGRRPSRQE